MSPSRSDTVRVWATVALGLVVLLAIVLAPVAGVVMLVRGGWGYVFGPSLMVGSGFAVAWLFADDLRGTYQWAWAYAKAFGGRNR